MSQPQTQELLKENSFYSSREEVKQAVALFCLHTHTDYRVKESRPTRVQYICHREGCEFYVKARKTQGEVISYHDSVEIGWKVVKVKPHSCQPHQKAAARNSRRVPMGSDLLSSSIVSLVTQDPSCRVSTISGSLASNVGSEIHHATYSMLWRAKKKANERVYGEEGYELLGAFSRRITERDGDSITKVFASNSNHYEGFFIAPGPFVRMWRECSDTIRKLVSLDATFSSSPQGGCIMLLSMLDGSQRAIILAFAHAVVENQATWTLFLGSALRAFPALNTSSTIIFSDQQKGLLNAIAQVLPQAVNCVCLFHRQMNLKATSGLEGKQSLIKEMIRIANEPTKEGCIAALDSLPDAAQAFMKRVPLEMWTHSHCPIPRWGITTTAFGEGLNNVIKKYKSLPLMAQLRGLLTKSYELLNNNFTRYSEAERLGRTVGEKIERRLQLNARYARERLTVLSAFENDASPIGEVAAQRDPSGTTFSVKLDSGTCSCGEFQQRGIPCAHAVAVSNALRIIPASFVAPQLRLSNVVASYRKALPIEPFDTMDLARDVLEEDTIHPPILRRRAGRPRIRRVSSMGESGDPESAALAGGGKRRRVVRCKKCNQLGHYQKTCNL